jgi:hypothetical protein
MANAGWDSVDFPGYDPYSVALGAYSATQTPWGLFDTAGGTSEWSEEAIFNVSIANERAFFGSSWAHGFPTNDRIYFEGGESPSIGLLNLGFRIASEVPAPSTCVGMGILGSLSVLRRRRQGGGPCPPCRVNADFNCDGDSGTDADIEAFFRVLAGGPC